MRLSILLAASIALSMGVSADSVRLDGATHEGVFVQETSSQYLILFPEDGAVLSVAKGTLSGDDLQRTEDPEARKALRTAWREKTQAQRSARAPELDTSPDARVVSEEPRAVFPDLYLPRLSERIQEAKSFINEEGVRTLILKGVPLAPELRRAREEWRCEVQRTWDEQVRYQQQIARERLATQQQAERYAAQAAYENQQRALSLQRQQLNNENQRLRNANLRQRSYSPWYPTVCATGYGPYRNSFFSVGPTHLSITSGPGTHTVFRQAEIRPRSTRRNVAPPEVPIARERTTPQVNHVVSRLAS